MASNGKKGSGNAAPTQNEQKKQTAEKKNDAVQHETEQQPVPNISVRIDKLFDDDTKKLKAFASANVGPFAVHGIRVFENEKGMFVSMPSIPYKDGQGNTQYDEVFHPQLKTVYLCLDNDNAGQLGCERISKAIHELGEYSVWRVPPQNKDWDEDLKALNGREAIPAEQISTPETPTNIDLTM